MNPDAPFPQSAAPQKATAWWYVCHGCGAEYRIADGVRNSEGCVNPNCHTPDIHIHSNADGETPKNLAYWGKKCLEPCDICPDPKGCWNYGKEPDPAKPGAKWRIVGWFECDKGPI